MLLQPQGYSSTRGVWTPPITNKTRRFPLISPGQRLPLAGAMESGGVRRSQEEQYLRDDRVLGSDLVSSTPFFTPWHLFTWPGAGFV